MTRRLIRLALVGVALLAGGTALAAQVAPGADTAAAGRDGFVVVRPVADSVGQTGWDSPEALALVAEARARRQRPRGDTGLVNYQSRANGYVYFYLDRTDGPGKTLVRVDQLALNVYWSRPGYTKQEIVGRRNVSRLPNRMYYHLDHLTVVQNEFDDIIRIGNGDEVRSVLHPAAPGAERWYQYRLADSLTLTLPGAGAPVRVYELAVRPRDYKQPGYIGSMYIDRRTGAIVRLTFTFTPASYVDRRLDFINISLENALFEGKYWLPHEQRLEIRRQIPELDFPLGAVIRGVFHIGDYRFNQTLPPKLFNGPRIVALPKAMQEAYPFPTGLYADLNEEGLSPPPDMATLREQATRLMKQKYLSGLPRVRLHFGAASSALRYDRAEGMHFGGGVSWTPLGMGVVDAMAGYGLGSQRLSLSGQARVGFGDGSFLRLRLYSSRLGDIGLRPAVPGAVNTLSAAFLGTDYLDPYFASGASLEGSRPWAGFRASLALSAERDGSATRAVGTALFRPSAGFRPVRPIDPGTMLSARAALSRAPLENGSLGWGGELALEAGTLDGRSFLRPTLRTELLVRSTGHAATLRLTAEGGAVLGTVPAQRLFLIGGPGTLPGYDVRTFAGDRFALGTAELSRNLWEPWVRLRATAAAGWTGFGASSLPAAWRPAPDVPAAWGVGATDGLRTSAGLGAGILWDILRIDLVRGLGPAGRWQAVLSVNPTLWDFL